MSTPESPQVTTLRSGQREYRVHKLHERILAGDFKHMPIHAQIRINNICFYGAHGDLRLKLWMQITKLSGIRRKGA